ncbi:unnamed protein product [Caenorhabditis auriculariae]|uniref:Uncharacterized protein n=1 Tax=Caenorhabditis auriculariae TaxID=2777116 RepID=A0A8S1HX10_9PELO|nr:unnamed protein product [Caenorhabditis auriculariae]
MTSKQDTPNTGHRHSLTIETNPLHLLPSNIRRFSQADTAHHPAAPLLSKFARTHEKIPESGVAGSKSEDDKKKHEKAVLKK